MKIIFVPMDERPCNAKFPGMISAHTAGVTLIQPGQEILGDKKQPAQIDRVWDFLFDHAGEAEFAVISLDMLYYGGLIPSRLHHHRIEELTPYYQKVIELHQQFPKLKILAFESIMRSPNHDTSEEEPDYYADFGLALHRRAFLNDKRERVGLDRQETAELASYTIPNEYIEDYEGRRAINLALNLKTLGLLKDHVIDFLVFPQDDATPYGYTAIAQKQVLKAIDEADLEQSVRIYPGSDEVGCSLVTRAYVQATGAKIQVYPFFASTLGPQIIPRYEDRPMNESLKSHIEVCGLRWTDDVEAADCVLAVNAPGQAMIESYNQKDRDVTYSSFRNLIHFTSMIERYLDQGKQVAICDSAYSNGGDLELMKYLEERKLIDRICSYAGWNTNCNTLGTTLAGMAFNYALPAEVRRGQLYYRLIEDVFYQANIRQVVIADYLPQHGLSYFVLKDQVEAVAAEIQKLLNEEIQRHPFMAEKGYTVKKVTLPWRRMFELNFDLKNTN